MRSAGCDCLLGRRVQSTSGSEKSGQRVSHHVLGVLVDADIAQLAIDGKGRDAVHQRPERPGDLTRLLAAQFPRRLAQGDHIKQVAEGLTGGDGQARVLGFVVSAPNITR